MTLYNIQTLIKQGKIVDVANLDPTESYLELAVYQEGNRKIGPGNANSYPSYVISLKELINGKVHFIYIMKFTQLNNGHS